ncbi:MAG: mechanosensitive ion channel domain-containing protein [Bacteroidota bacterium]
MEKYQYQIVETIIVIIVFLLAKLITRRIISKVGAKFKYQSGRIKITNKIVSFLLSVMLAILLMIIWGVDQSELVIFLSATLTILGVALFAQWSIISNITSTLIIFFNHPVRIGDSLTIMDKDYEIEGKLSDIGVFFIIIKTKDNKRITIPSNVFMQKMIRKDDTVKDEITKNQHETI